MKSIKDELQYIILGDEPPGQGSALKKTQTFLRRYAETSVHAEKQQYLKSKETEAILAFANENSLLYQEVISESNFISEGAEQKVYRLNESQIIKTNAGIFYEYFGNDIPKWKIKLGRTRNIAHRTRRCHVISFIKQLCNVLISFAHPVFNSVIQAEESTQDTSFHFPFGHYN